MRTYNITIVVGIAGSPPKLINTESGGTIAFFSLATTESIYDKETQSFKNVTEWHKIVAFGKLADIVKNYVTKGSLILVEGSLKTKKFPAKDGSMREATEINAKRINVIKSKEDKTGEPQGQPEPLTDEFNDEIGF